jgi:large conductance mechanosensitive channel
MHTQTQTPRRRLLPNALVDVGAGIFVGAVCAAIVSMLAKDTLTPLVDALVGQPQFGLLTFRIGGAAIAYGQLINAVVAFASLAGLAYFFFMRPAATRRTAAATARPALRLHVTANIAPPTAAPGEPVTVAARVKAA